MNEFTRPWKLVTLLIGISFLIIGSFYFDAPDWDIPISLIMAISTYFFAPFSLRAFFNKNYHLFPIALFLTWFSVDGCYAIYWYFKNPQALELMRAGNFFASLSLYFICGLIWLPKCSLKQAFSIIVQSFSNPFKPITKLF